MTSPSLKGLDQVTVEEAGEGLWWLRMHFVPSAPGVERDPVPEGLAPGQLRILLDDVPDRHVEIRRVEPGPGPAAASALVRTAEIPSGDPHDPGVRHLELIRREDIDPLFARAAFRFQTAPPGAAVVPRSGRGPAVGASIEIDYLVKDYESFRRLLLERMAFYVPNWTERSPADIGVTLVEVLAYAADALSYTQDAVTTEAHLDTARRRISVRRHTRLLDFRLQEGTNARAWVQIEVEAVDDGVEGARELELPAGIPVLTSTPRTPGVVVPGSKDYHRAVAGGALVFQTATPVRLVPEHHAIELHTWGARDYLLPAGATRATLVGHLPRLGRGDVLAFERREPDTEASEAPPDPRNRHVVRLAEDPVAGRDPLTDTAITEIVWFEEDALERDLPVSRTVGSTCQRGLAVARGNLVLADHGAAVEDLLPPVPADGLYEPPLPRRELTYREPFDAEARRGQPACRTTEQQSWRALPAIELIELAGPQPPSTLSEARRRVSPADARFAPRFDLLSSDRFAPDFVVEVDDDGRPRLRFGDGEAGRRPRPGSRFLARYRVGSGPRGNVGCHALKHLVLDAELLRRAAARGLAIRAARNPLPGVGGTHPRPTEHARVYAPERLRTFAFQQRLITEEDFARVTERHPEVRRAVAGRDWSGSSPVAIVHVQRTGGRDLDPALMERLRRFLEPYLPVGWDLVLAPPRYVPLDIRVAVRPASGVRSEVLYRHLTGRLLEPGQGLFDPEALSFGEAVYLSQVTALLMAVPGVADLTVEAFHRWGEPPGEEMATGRLPIGRREIARLDNDPEAPQHGMLTVRVLEAS